MKPLEQSRAALEARRGLNTDAKFLASVLLPRSPSGAGVSIDELSAVCGFTRGRTREAARVLKRAGVVVLENGANIVPALGWVAAYAQPVPLFGDLAVPVAQPAPITVTLSESDPRGLRAAQGASQVDLGPGESARGKRLAVENEARVKAGLKPRKKASV
jgi:hypothetical protein